MLSPYTFVTSFCEHQPLTNQNLLTHLHTPTHIHSPLLYIHTHRIYRFHVLIRIQNTHKTIGCIKKALFLAAWTTPVSKYCFLFRGRHIYTYRTLFIHWIFSNTYVLIRTIKKNVAGAIFRRARLPARVWGQERHSTQPQYTSTTPNVSVARSLRLYALRLP